MVISVSTSASQGKIKKAIFPTIFQVMIKFLGRVTWARFPMLSRVRSRRFQERGARHLFETAASNRAHVIFNGQSDVQTTFDITLECFHVLAALHILLYTIQVLDQSIRCSMF